MSKNMNVPKLRFSEFSGEWEEKILDKIAAFSKGKGIPKSDIDENGQIECIRYGELYTQYNELIQNIVSKTNIDRKDLVLSEYGDIIIPASGETQIDIATASCVLKDNVALGGDLNIIKSKEDGVFLSYYLNNVKKFDIARLSQGVSVVHLYSSQLKTLKLNIPSKPEQEKIASFLSSIDTKIEQLTKKESLLQEYKKGVMQKIFNQEIRFSPKGTSSQAQGDADDGSEFCDWEEKKLGDIGKFKSGTGFPEKEQGGKIGIPFYKVSDMNLPTNEEIMTISNNYVSENQIKQLKLKVYKEKSIIFAKVGAAIFLERKRISDNFLIDNNMMAFIPNENIAFIKHLFNTIRLSKYAQVGALPSYNASDLEIIKIKLPCLEEQTKIANFLSSIDKKIENTKTQLEKTKEFKKALLQQMFV